MFVAPAYHNKIYSAFFLLSCLATTGVTVSRRQSPRRRTCLVPLLAFLLRYKKYLREQKLQLRPTVPS